MSDKNIVSKIDEDAFLITSMENDRRYLEQAVREYETRENYRSTYFNETSGFINFKIEDVDRLALNAQTSLNNIIQINNIIRYFVNKNDILGKVYEAIETNVNSEWTLSYPNYSDDEKESYEIVDELIRDFNKKINLNRVIIECVPMSYLEGNYAMYLRKDRNKNYQIDYYPLGVYEVSDYEIGGDPYILINIKELESRLRKVYKKNRSNKALFYENIDEEIKDIYPEEVYEAYRKKELYAVLDIKNTGIIRINNFRRKYGLSPIFKSLKPIIRLENIQLSDDRNTLVRGKKIIFQKLIKELVTQPKELPNITWSAAQAKAHTDLMAALSGAGTSVFTGTPWTENISFIEPKIEPTNVQTVQQKRNEIMTSVGISYLNSEKGTFGAAQVSINELMKMIDKIGEQLSDILYKWYRELLKDHGFDDEKYCPTIKVLNSERLSLDIQIQLARLLNTEMNASLESAYNVLGLDVKTEAKRRIKEKEDGYDEIFAPRQTAYTNSGNQGDKNNGRPSDGEDLDKVDYDEEYNEENGR